MIIKGIIFDFDGLILDTETPEFQVWQNIYMKHGVELKAQDYAVCIGGRLSWFDPIANLTQHSIKPVNGEEIMSEFKQKSLQLINQQPCLPGVQSYLQRARQIGLKIGIASSSPHNWVENHLLRLGMHSYFDFICCEDDVNQVKPDPAVYQCVLSKMGLMAGQAIALEDSPNGIRAAKGADLFCVAIPNPLTRLLNIDLADLILESLDQISLDDLLVSITST